MLYIVFECVYIYMNIYVCTLIFIGLMCMFRCVIFQLKTFSRWTVSYCCGWCWLHIDKWKLANSKTIQHNSLQKQDPSLFRETAVYTIDSILRHYTHKKDKAWVEQVLSCCFFKNNESSWYHHVIPLEIHWGFAEGIWRKSTWTLEQLGSFWFDAPEIHSMFAVRFIDVRHNI